MSRAALYTKHTRLADQIANAYFLPNGDADDARQEARLALWIATGTYQPDRGATFRTYAAMAIRAHLTDRVRGETREKRRPPGGTVSYEQLELISTALADATWEEKRDPLPRTPDLEATVLAREELRDLVARRDEMLAAGRRRFSWAESKRRQRATA